MGYEPRCQRIASVVCGKACERLQRWRKQRSVWRQGASSQQPCSYCSQRASNARSRRIGRRVIWSFADSLVCRFLHFHWFFDAVLSARLVPCVTAKYLTLTRNDFCRAMRCISAAYAVMRCVCVCVSVCVSVTFVRCVKTNKDICGIFLPSGSQAILVFPCKTGWRYSDGNPHNGGVECRWGRQKNAILNKYLASLHTGLHCYQPYESRSVKNKAATNRGKRRAEHSPRRPSSVVRTRRLRSVCDGLDVIRRRRRSTPRTQPLWSEPRFLLP